MRKPELAAAIAEETGLSKNKAQEVLNAVTDQISTALAKDEGVTLPGFGSFTVRERSARTGRNPQTGASIKIPVSKSVGFKAGKPLREAIK